jgi:hypothetical protein
MHDSPRWVHRAAAALIALGGLLMPSLAYPQGSAVYQNGNVVPGHLAKWFTTGRIGDAGGLTGDSSGLGLAPFAITDNNGLGLCLNSGPTTAAFRQFCLGHDSNGDALMSVDQGALNVKIGNQTYPFPGAGNGNMVAPTSPAPTAGNVVLWNGGTTTKDGGAIRLGPTAYGCSTAASDNTACLKTFFESGKPLSMDGVYNAVGPINVAGCPDMIGGGATKTGIGITGSGGGLSIVCQSPAGTMTGGHVSLSRFSLWAKRPGAGTALTVNFANTNAFSKIPTPSLDMTEVYASGDILATNNWSDGVVVYNASNCNLQRNYVAGLQGNFGATTAGFTFRNETGSGGDICTFVGNWAFGVGIGFRVIMGVQPGDMEGFAFIGNSAIAVNTGFLVDSSASTVVPPSFTFTNNQTGLNGAAPGNALNLNKVAQVSISGNTFYSNDVSPAISITNSSSVFIYNNPAIYTFATANPSGAIKIVNSQIIAIDGNDMSNGFAVGVDIDAASTAVGVGGLNIFRNIPTPVRDLSGGTSNQPVFRTAVKLVGAGQNLVQGSMLFNGAAAAGNGGNVLVGGDTNNASIRLGDFVGTVTPYINFQRKTGGVGFDARIMNYADDAMGFYLKNNAGGGSFPLALTTAAVTVNNPLVLPSPPTSCTGQVSGTVWKNGAVLNICP